MPRRTKPLHCLSEKHLRKRLRGDAASILTGGEPAAKISSPKSHQSSSVDLLGILNPVPTSETCSASGSGSVPSSDPVLVVCSETKDVEDALHLQDLFDQVKKIDSDCEICLLCLCGTDCLLCSHDEKGCRHCDKCTSGELWNSDDEPTSSSDDDDDDDDDDNDVNESSTETDFRTRLRVWAITHGIREDALKSLLSLIRSNFTTDLPADPRTLKQTPSVSVKTRECPPGLYWNAGIANGLSLLNFKDDISVIKLDFSVDGAPLAKSSKSCFWPILCRVDAIDSVFLVGAYHGHDKPSDSNDFFQEFCDELVLLCTNGISLKGVVYTVECGLFIADAPAKAFALNIKGHTAYCGCTKCTVWGKYVAGRVVYPQLNLPLRLDADFRRMTQEDHHHRETILLKLPGFNMVDDVVLDYMHLVLLGVCRKLINIWISGRVPNRLQSRVLEDISDKLSSVQSFMPREFSRKPRPLDTVKFWKAVEWRGLLFLLGPVVLHILKKECKERYNHFLVLHVAMTILASEHLLTHYKTSYPHQLLTSFVKGFEQLYGTENLSHNVHNLVHLAHDVENHGCVDKFSAFPFENFLQKVKKLVRKGDKPLQQLAKRYAEIQTIQCSIPNADQKKAVYSRQHTRGPLFRGCKDPQYGFIQLKDFSLDLSTANRCCGLLDGSIVEAKNIAFCQTQNCMVVIGRRYQTKTDVYDYPQPSSHLGIWKVTNLSLLMSWPVTLICCKYVRLPFKDGHAVFPMLHIDSSRPQLDE